jgi:Glu-tRNA(Gln) amidotransferase subunit E-like FAD-binding protein
MKTATQEIFHAIEQLPSTELDDLFIQVLQLRAQRQLPTQVLTESELLKTINVTIPSALQDRFNELVAKRQSITITDEELDELITITDQSEQLNAQRITALTQLAQLRNQSLSQIMKALGIQTPSCV